MTATLAPASSGCSAAWLARHVRDVEAPGSNPGIPTCTDQHNSSASLLVSTARPDGGRSTFGPEVPMDIAEFQSQMRTLYGARDRERGLARTFAWFTEECGELSRALFRGDDEQRLHEFSDVLAWLA